MLHNINIKEGVIMEKKRYIGNTKVSRLGFGAWPLGNTAHGKTMSIEEGVALVEEAVKQGVNFFDTAPNYALGRSEIILGKALKNHRNKVVINSKFGHHPDDSIDFNENRIESSINGSLKRLQTDYLDSVILHNPDYDILMGRTGHFTILERLKEKGIIKGYGVSIDTRGELETVLNNQSVDVIELYFNVFAQVTRDLLDTVKQKGIALIIKVPLDSGWLTGKYTNKSSFSDIRSRWTKEDLNRRYILVNKLKDFLSAEKLTQYAMQFLWSYDAITTVIPGIRTIEQLHEHVSYANEKLNKDLQKKLETFYDCFIANDPLRW